VNPKLSFVLMAVLRIQRGSNASLPLDLALLITFLCTLALQLSWQEYRNTGDWNYCLLIVGISLVWWSCTLASLR